MIDLDARAVAERVREADLAIIVSTLAESLERLSGRSLLITGGAGFLGYYLVQAPLRWNDEHPGSAPIRVTVIDNFARGAPNWLLGLAGRRELDLLEHDVRTALPRSVAVVDFMVHAAGIASPTYYRRHPLETIDANVAGLRLLLDQCRLQAESGQSPGGLLFLSSSEIYGDPPPEFIPTPETYRGNVSCTGPRACYDEAKRFGETLCVTYARQFGVPVTIARPFNNYGPGMKITDGRVIADLCRQALAGGDLVLYSDGSPTRTFCYVADAVTGYYLTLLHGRPGEPYNIGAEGPEVSMSELAGRLATVASVLFSHPGGIVHRNSVEPDYLIDNPSRRRPDITKARFEFGYQPQVDLDDGLHRTLTWSAGNRGGEER